MNYGRKQKPPCALAIKLAPDEAALHINLANVLKALSRGDDAQASLLKALELAPDNALAHYNLGNLLRDQGQLQTALQSFDRALQLAPQHLDIRYNRACLLFDLDQLDAARHAFEALLQAHPQHARGWHNLGNTLRALGQFDAVRQCYQRALQIERLPVTPYALGTLDLLCGNWAAGWAGYELRWAATGKAPFTTALPQWRGEAVAGSARLLVVAEQGFGDQIQFARFLPLLLSRFASITVVVPQPLRRLLQDNLGQANLGFVSQVPGAAGYQYHLPFMSMAAVLEVDEALLARIAVPYLAAPAAVPGAHGLQVGLVWQGNAAQPDNRLRSIHVAELAPLLALPDVHWHSLQFRPTDPLPAGVNDATTGWHDFADAAVAIQQLDLVITVCTVTAHLAGALGKPVWLLCRFDADWRWQTQRPDSPWYPSMRIFRQHAPRDWQGAVADVAAALARHAG